MLICSSKDTTLGIAAAVKAWRESVTEDETGNVNWCHIANGPEGATMDLDFSLNASRSPYRFVSNICSPLATCNQKAVFSNI